MTHSLGWQDEGMAEVLWCGDTYLKETFIITSDPGKPPRECPMCGGWLRLEWRVRAIEVPQPFGAT